MLASIVGWIGFRSGSRRLFSAALAATVSLGTVGLLAGDLHAQLRSGRGERSLYYPSPANEREADIRISPGPSATRGTKVRTRLAADATPRSIIDAQDPKQEEIPAKPAERNGTMPAAPSVSEMRNAPEPLPMDDNMSSFDESYAMAPGSCNCGRCGNDYFADLAPGCYDSACQPGCDWGGCGGPLARLLGSLSIRAEVPLFWRRGIGLPPLVTTATAGTAANVAGRLGDANTRILLGNQLANDELQAGVRINVAAWLDPNQYRGVIVRYTNAGDQSTDFSFDSGTNPILARPINNITTGTSVADTQLVAFPGDSVGNIRVGATSSVDGFDIVMRRLAYRDRFTRVDWLMGYQHNRIAENLTISSFTNVVGNVPPLTGSTIAVTDQIATSNNFNGAVLGIMSRRHFAYWKFEALARMGFGNLERVYSASGSTVTTSATGVVTTDDQGLLVRNTNNQTRRDDTFVIAPEWGINAGYCLTRNIDFSIGYNYLLVGKVAQPGRQIDRTVNLSDPLTGFQRPGFVLNTQNYWVHSLNLGVQWRY